MSFQELISNLGFPIGIALYFVYENKRQTDKYVELAKQAAVDSQASTEAINKAAQAIDNNTMALEKNTIAFEKIMDRFNAT